MITFTNFGKNCRLGSQIFQYAFLFGLYKAKGYEFCIDKKADIFNCFDIEHNFSHSTNCKFLTKTHNYTYFDCDFPEKYTDNTNYDGHFMSEKYFKHCKQELISSLKFKKQWQTDFNYEDVVGIHVRRGDYLQSRYHRPMGVSYFEEAKKYFLNKKFLVFSDDIKWCINNNIGDYYSTNNNHYSDLYHMTLCSSLIMSPSTFSWWGAYLSEKEKIIIPQKWFNEKGERYNHPDMFCDNWILI